MFKENNKIKLSSNRSFGIVFFLFFLIISIYPFFKGGEIRLTTFFISLIFLILGILNSNLLAPLNKVWFKFGIFLGYIVSPLVMGIIFFLVVTPIAIIMKLLRKDLLNIKKNQNKTYWIERTGPKSKMKNQF
tara:strand:- start:393 stop:788 length:396 start_codon:yes stop_codon:yes gene_type:complete